MTSQLTIVATIEAEPGQTDRVGAELLKLVEPTLAEPGCIQYDLHRDNDNPAVFLFYENWQSRELWQAHMDSAHVAEFAQATAGAVAKFTVNEMTKL